MKTRFLRLAATLVVACAAGSAPTSAWGESRIVVPEGGFVLDGGDIEAAALESQRCLEPAAAGSSLSERASASDAAVPAPETQAPAPRPTAFEYSDGYRVRLKIHKYASFATLPLFVAQYAVGQKLYNGNGSDGTRSLHGALAAGTAALFAVNTVTGVWNLSEGRKDPNHRTKRMVHGLLMLAADAGFVATGMLAPDSEHGESGFESSGGNRSTHRTVALVSMGVATVAYLMMLIH